MLDKVALENNWPEILYAQPSIGKTAAPLLEKL